MTLMTCWGKWNATWPFISTLFCWCLSTIEILIEQLHEAWDVQSCLLVLKLAVQRRKWWFSLVLRSAQVRGASRLRSGSPRCLYSDLSCHIKDYQNGMYYLNFLKKISLFIWYMCTEPKGLYRNGSVWIRVQLHPYLIAIFPLKAKFLTIVKLHFPISKIHLNYNLLSRSARGARNEETRIVTNRRFY